MARALYLVFIACIVLGSGSPVQADGVVVSKIYHPYVSPLEWEIESQTYARERDALTGETDDVLQKIGVGHALNDWIKAEAYVIASDDPVSNHLDWVGFEFEALMQLSEQGEYSFDYGLLLEVERDWQANNNELSVKALIEREFGKLSVTLNPGVVYEWGDTRQNEFETRLNGLLRYRYHRSLEPGVEVHLGQNTKMIGPSMAGQFRFSGDRARSMSYNLGAFFPLDKESSEHTFRLQIEYEF
jgi:hypothetical protein